MTGSIIFRRNRSLGYVSNNIPALTKYIPSRKDTLIVTCIGRAFQIFTTSHFRLLQISDVHSSDITCMALNSNYIFTACDSNIYAWKLGKHREHIYKGHTAPINFLLPFGDHLIAVDEANVFKVWNILSEDVYLEIQFKKKEFFITAITHPPTYINKIVLGSEQGKLQIWNIIKNKLVHEFSGYTSIKVTALESAPAVDVIAVGHLDGTIILLNLKFDEIIITFKQDWGPVTQISFRTDSHPIMATASTNGNVVFWNLEERQIASQIIAHHDAVTTCICLPNEPLVLTTSPDNSMKLWIFDMPADGARLLRLRDGHSAPPLYIRYHGSRGECLLSAGEDSSLRIVSTISESLSCSMGKASYNRKASKRKNQFQDDPLIMPPITCFTSEVTRDKEWDSIACVHTGLVQVTTWSFYKKKMGDLKLVPEQYFNKNRKDFSVEATCLDLSQCGNFVVIGYSLGDVERFNIQSGIHRATYGNPAHENAVRGVACDGLNEYIVTGSSDGFIKFWNFKANTERPTLKMNVHTGISLFCNQKDSGMLGVVLDNFLVYIIDCDTKGIIRKFQGHLAKINDIAFSPDFRWLITASMDSTIKIWDIPSSYMIDHFKVERPCVSLAISPAGDYLATAHVNCLGIYLWCNKTIFNHISLRSINPFDEAPYIDLHSKDLKETVDLVEEINDLKIAGEEVNFKYNTPSQLNNDLITMSTLSASRWYNLLDLELIKKRNKPKLPPQSLKQVPFFIPTVAGPELKFDLVNNQSESEQSKHIHPNNFINLTSFGNLLMEAKDTGNYQICVDNLKEFGPSKIDFEIKSLHPLGGGTYELMQQFLIMIKFILNSNVDYELVQAYLGCFLNTYRRTVLENNNVIEVLKEIQELQNKKWDIIEQKLLYTLGVVGALRNFVH